MNDSKTFVWGSFENREISYDVNEYGLIYRPDDDRETSLIWQDIQYIEDRSGHRVNILANKELEVPIRYTTDKFTVLLKTICLKLAEIRKENFCAQKFTLTTKYFFHFNLVVSVLILALIGSLMVGKILFITFSVLLVPSGMFLQRQPLSLALDHHNLIIRTLFTKISFDYKEIHNINFEIKNNDYGSTLCVLINLKNGKKITVKKIEDIVLFFIMLQIKLNEIINNNVK